MGGLSYPNQIKKYVFGSDTTTVNLTTSYAGNVSNNIDCGYFSEITFYFEYTTGAAGAGNSLEIKIEGAAEEFQNTPSFCQENFVSISGGTMTHVFGEHTFVGAAGSTTYKGFFFSPPNHRQLRISVKETIVAGAAGTLKMKILLGGV